LIEESLKERTEPTHPKLQFTISSHAPRDRSVLTSANSVCAQNQKFPYQSI